MHQFRIDSEAESIFESTLRLSSSREIEKAWDVSKTFKSRFDSSLDLID